MKKKLGFLGACFMVMILASSAFAGGIVNKTNWSAEYIRTMNRNAATDFADIVFYNPAGTVQMTPGGYLNVSAHYFPKLYEHTIVGGPFAGNFESDEPSIVPGIFALYNTNRWSLFFGVSNVVGGGKVDYEDGSLRTVLIGAQTLPMLPPQAGYNRIVSQQISAEQIGPGILFGGAIKATDNLSFSAGVRYIDASQEASGSVTFGSAIAGVPDATALIDYEWDAKGVGGVFGVNYALSRSTNLAARYETRTALRYNYSINSTEPIGRGVLASLGTEDGMTRREDHPATLGLGVSHQLLPKLRAETNLTYYFNSDARWERTQEINGVRQMRRVDDGYDVGLALEYAFTPELLGSIGYLYTNTGLQKRFADDISMNLPENPNLDAHSVGLGTAYALKPNLVLNAGLGGVFYVDDDITTPVGVVEYEKRIYFIALGVQYKFL
jgi:long-chain fatty acid transport protein